MSDHSDARELISELFDDLPPEEEALMMDTFALGAALSHPMAPPARLKARILRSMEKPRYAFLDRVAWLLDLTVERARAVLDSLDDLSLWEPGGEGCLLRHLDAGPSLANAVVGLVHVKAGIRFPRHVHVGEETVLILEGGIEDDSGRVFLPGDLAPMPAGSEHEFKALPGDDLLYLAVVQEGVDFSPAGGSLILPRR